MKKLLSLLSLLFLGNLITLNVVFAGTICGSTPQITFDMAKAAAGVNDPEQFVAQFRPNYAGEGDRVQEKLLGERNLFNFYSDMGQNWVLGQVILKGTGFVVHKTIWNDVDDLTQPALMFALDDKRCWKIYRRYRFQEVKAGDF